MISDRNSHRRDSQDDVGGEKANIAGGGGAHVVACASMSGRRAPPNHRRSRELMDRMPLRLPSSRPIRAGIACSCFLLVDAFLPVLRACVPLRVLHPPA